MAFRDSCTFAVGCSFMFLVVSVVGIDKVAKFAQGTFQMDSFDFGIVEMSI
jgi:hypothetical protein